MNLEYYHIFGMAQQVKSEGVTCEKVEKIICNIPTWFAHLQENGKKLYIKEDIKDIKQCNEI